MSLDFAALLNPVLDHAAESAYFEAVNGHEPKRAPASGGLTFAAWLDFIGPAVGASGLASTTALVIVNSRIYRAMLSEPQDAIDPDMTAAANALFTAYSGDFDFGGQVRNVDLLGRYGQGLSLRAGYISQDNHLFRVQTIAIPLVVNDAWDQGS